MRFMPALALAALLVAFPTGLVAPPLAAQPLPGLAAEDAGPVLDARIAALKTVLKLTPEQEKLWPPVEAAIRHMVEDGAARRIAYKAAPAPTNVLDVLATMADEEAARARDLRALVDAARPFVATLTPVQTRRIPAFLGLGGGEPIPGATEFWIFDLK